jgi:hypothetical protein
VKSKLANFDYAYGWKNPLLEKIQKSARLLDFLVPSIRVLGMSLEEAA